MHAPAPAHPPYQPPARGTVVALRVFFVAATVLSAGLLAWIALLRAALVQRRQLGWWLFGADLALLVGIIVVVGVFPETDWRTDAAVGALLLQMVGAVAYYLVADTRGPRMPGYGTRYGAFQQAGYGSGAGYGGGYGPGPANGPGTGNGYANGSGYGYPPAAYPTAPSPSPYGPPPGPAPTPPPVHAQETQPYAGPAPHSGPHPSHASQERPQRIDRVRAELDELSDYLRKEEGR
ncbi:hypothetical protein [Streptomyces piniterrae]|uniref:hypothetical protein n=1 Tax=Streptomyces piniterrae TaxID=2571125 RepID=UPI00145D6293|nr:hypothetical protein [Streptomyces piniterrae]